MDITATGDVVWKVANVLAGSENIPDSCLFKSPIPRNRDGSYEHLVGENGTMSPYYKNIFTPLRSLVTSLSNTPSRDNVCVNSAFTELAVYL